MDSVKTISSGTRVYRPLIDEQVTTEDWKKAERELNETKETRATFLEVFRERVENEEEFVPRTDDVYLLRYLRARKFNLDKAFKLLHDHNKFRRKHPALFPSPSTIVKKLNSNLFNYLPHRDHMGRAIFVAKAKNWDLDQLSHKDFITIGHIFGEYVIDNPVTQINGYTGIFDFEGSSFKQFATFCSPRNILLLRSIWQECFPGRFKIAYCVNCHQLVNKSWVLCKPFMKEKYRTRVLILGSKMTELHQYIDPSILPQEYGGDLPPLNCDDILEKILGQEQFNNRKFGYQDNLN